MKRFGLAALVLLSAVATTQAFLDEPGKPDYPWWKKTIIYQIYPRSFKDSNGDGIGDIPGIISELDHFVYMGIETLWLSPFYRSPQKDFGYDISDMRDVDPMFGTIEDFRELVRQCKAKGLRLIVDFVPNHTSTEHEWFKRSEMRDGKYKDYYVWTDGITLDNGTQVPPNNWLSVFGKSAWQWSSAREQFYLHQFVIEQADLNFRNPDVREEQMLNIRYWLDLGIDGLRMDAIGQLYEVTNLTWNEPLSGRTDVPSDSYFYLKHPYTEFVRPEVFQEIGRWQSILDGMEKVDGRERFMVLEFYTDSDTRADFARYNQNVFNLDMVDSLTIPTNASQIMGLIAQEYYNKPSNYWPTFVIGNHDRHRVATKYGEVRANGFNMLLLLLKGTPTTYYGEELGMIDIDLSFEDTVDPWGVFAGPDRYRLVSRDFNRSPMQWTPGSQAGFTTGDNPWLPVQKRYKSINVETEKADPKSSMNLYKEYAALRKVDAFAYGDIDVDVVTNDNVLSFTRSFGNERYLVAINLGQSESTDNYSKVGSVTGQVVANTGAVDTSLDKGSYVNLGLLKLQPGDGVVLKLQ